MSKPDFAAYAAMIDTLRASIRGVDMPDGSIVSSKNVTESSVMALDSVIRALDADAATYVADFPEGKPEIIFWNARFSSPFLNWKPKDEAGEAK